MTATVTPRMPGVTDRVREFFLLRAAEREVRALPEPARTAAQRELTLAFQKRDAAETLWPRGSCAEALRLARASVDAAVSALESFAAGTETPRAWVTRAQQIAATAQAAVASRALPELEADARPEDEETFRVLVEAGLAVERVVGPHLAAPVDIARLRRGRIGWAVGSVAFAVLFVMWAMHAPDFRQASASTQYGDHVADRAIDGDTKTAWILPDHTPGFLELTLGRARKVRALHLLSSNPPFNDRMAKDVHVDCFLGDQLVKGVDFTLPVVAAGIEPPWVDVPVDAAKCDRVKLEVKSSVGSSAAVAEIELK